MNARVGQIVALYESRGGIPYSRDRVSHLEHALQAAAQARAAGAQDSLVVAALLHDVGHLLAADDGLAAHGVDDEHEAHGSAFLGRYFAPEVARPVGLHVAAKRYLCWAEPDYAEQLSPMSVRSLALQGGPFTSAEARAFEQRFGFREAVMLRRWDENAKVPGLRVPDLAQYHALLERCLVPATP
jgi:phosphonate degradation associated HDIG domain protein